ncbi:HNH endonuclease signature motif containing protein [Nocardioides cheoyonin]|uniref:HNH endonuclease signature motif containing protein n=1 Tax=Nocardioides cheoyonin TaxID=3156615 RepID=UPI0032B4F8A8
MHQFTTVIDSLETALKDAAGLDPAFLSPDDAGETLLALRRIQGRITELVLRVMSAGQPLADESAARDVAGWLVAREVADARPAHRELRLAQALARWEATRAALAAGDIGLEHASVIVQVLDDLAADPSGSPGAEVLARAEAHLLQLATEHRPSDLRRLAVHLLEVAAPEVADDADARALARAEERARRKVSMSITPIGDGLTKIYAVVPTAVGERLRTMVEAYAQPRIAALEAVGQTRSRHRILADAFGQLLETIDPARLPAHGGDATTVVVTVGLDRLRTDLTGAGLGVADLGGEKITAAEARRLACTAKILPAVLDGRSEPLDLGRAKRLFTPAQRKALRLRDRRCRAEGCTVPAAWTDAHHLDPWSRGGTTDLDNGVLFCHHHHRCAHDPAYDLTRLANGDYRFHRRR